MARMNDVFEVVGFRRIDYIKKSDGSRVCGYEVYLSLVEDPVGLVGVYGEKQWLSDKYAVYKPEVGHIVRKAYNRFGTVEDLIPCG